MKPTLANVTAAVEEFGALQHPQEALRLLEWLAPAKPRLHIEVGVWRGGNAALLKTFFPDLRIIGVDVLTIDSPEVSDAPSLRDNVKRFGIEMVQGDTKDPATVARVREMTGGQRADYLFIDASHDTDSVNADFDLWSPLSARTGFHDVHNPMVYEAWMRCTGLMHPNPRTFALWKETDGHGIGVVMT